MKNESIFSTLLLLFCALFISHTAAAQTQWNQNISKTITTNASFNATANAILGIGTSTPANAKMDILGSIGNTIATFRRSTDSRGVSIVGDWPGVYFNSYFNGGSKTMASGYAGIVNFDPDNGRIDFGVTGTAATTTNESVDLTTRMSINKDGNVGIGTATPASKLDIASQDAIRAYGYEPFITLLDINTYKSARIQAAHGDIAFFKGDPDWLGGFNYAAQMVIKDNGNVGIGYATPESKLDIAAQDGMRIFGYQPFMTLLDNNTYRSNRIQSANGDLVFWKGVANASTGGYVYDAPMVIKDNGNVLIGTPYKDPGYKLAVGGKIICEELKVQLRNSWPDYVFASDYKLKSLEEVEAHIKSENHLPGIPAAAEMEKDGIEVGDMQKKMMEKIEELTLYLIDQNKRLEQLEQDNNALRTRLDKTESNQK